MTQQALPSFARRAVFAPILAAAALAGCAVTPPSAPTILALPSPGKNLNRFQQEDYACRNYASQAVAPSVSSAQANPNVAAPLIGAVGGAAVGALMGAGSRNPGAVAGFGAGAGALVGTSVGAQQQGQTQYSLQQQYDNAYAQCITSKGNTISQPQPVMVAPPSMYYEPRPYYYYGPRHRYYYPY